MLKTLISTAFVAATCTLAVAPAAAQQYPSRPVRMVVPVPPGGGSDAIARVLADRMGQSLKQPVVVDNKPGAGGMIGSDLVAKAPPDGHTVLLINNAFVINPWLYKLPFNTTKDFIPVALVATSPNVLVAHPSVKANNVKELIETAKREPGKLTVAVSTGQMSHLGSVALEQAAGIDLLLIPYKGAGVGNIDLLAGNVDLSFGTAPTYLKQISSGKLKALGVGGTQPLASLPGVPTMAQTLPGFEVDTWFTLFVPAGTPTPVVERLRKEVEAAIKTPEVAERIQKDGYFTGQPLSQAQLTEKLQTEMAKWGGIIKKANVRVE